MTTVLVRTDDVTVIGDPGLGTVEAMDMTNPRQAMEARLSDIPVAKRRFFFDPSFVTTETSGGNTSVTALRNLLGNVANAYGTSATLRDPASAQAEHAQVTTATNGAPCLKVPLSGSTVEPYAAPFPLDLDAYTIFGAARIETGVLGVAVGSLTSAMTGVGVELVKVATTHYLRYYYNPTQYIEHAASVQNKWLGFMLTFDVAVGRRFYVNGALIGEATDAAGKAIPTQRDFQLFGRNNTGANAASGKYGILGMVDVDLSGGGYAAQKAAIEAYIAGTYPIGA